MIKRNFTRLAIVLLILVILLSLGALVAIANAGTSTTTNMTVVKDDSGNEMYTIETKNGIVYYKTRFIHSNTAVLSYHTKFLYFTKEKTNSNPTSIAYYEIDREDLRIETRTESFGSITYETFLIPEYMVLEAIEYLYGHEYRYDQVNLSNVTLYLSHGFIIKRRNTAQDDWILYRGDVYSSLSNIRDKAKDPYNGSTVVWSIDTKRNFPFYFDCPLKINVAKYSIIVDTDGGGSVGQSHSDAYLNEQITIYAYPDDDHTFAGWEVANSSKGSISNFDKTSAESSFAMPAGDLIIKAKFQKKSLPPVTKAPEPTRDPAGPTATPAPTPTPVPIATPEPEYHSQTDIIVRHYSTDAGYYVGQMHTLPSILKASDDYAFGYWATDSGIKEGGQIAASGPLYSIGTDSAGNEWFFIPSGSNATYVHPKTYKGISVESADVKKITELTFPDKITMSGTTYTVTSIGGGTNKYFQNAANSSVKPEYENYNDSGRYDVGSYYSWYKTKIVGVLGNGSYRSHGSLSGSSIDLEFENSYYFENTTLKYVTIPSTVTKIENYAFYLCQALEQVIGGEGVLTVGECAFASFNSTEAFQMSSGVAYQSTIIKWYYYNCSKSTSITDTISLWRTHVLLPHDLVLPAFSKVQTIKSRAFEYRSNLSDVFLPNTLQTIDSNAFNYCFLESITIPNTSTTIYDSSSTLGTKGSNVKEKTLITTNPGAKAMDYGLKYEDYYDLRAGYSVTYVKNAMPNETYISNAMLVKQYANAVENISNSYYDSSDNLHSESYFLDENGYLYWKTSDKEATNLLPGIVFEAFKRCNHVLFAVSKSGELYELFEEAVTKLAVPAGARNFQFVGISNYTDNSYRRSSYLVYFLNASGQICILLPGNTVVTVQADYPSAGTPYKFDRFVVELEGTFYEGTQFIYDDEGDYRYDWKLAPQIVAHAASDSPYKPNSLVRFYGKYYSTTSYIASCYQPPEEIVSYSTPAFWVVNPSGGTYTDQSGQYREHFQYGDARYSALSGSPSSNGYELYFATDTAFCQAKYIVSTANLSKHHAEERNGSYQITTLMTGNFGNATTSSYHITDYQKTWLATVEIDDQVYGFVRYWGASYAYTARLFSLFSGSVEQVWEMSGTISSSEGETHDYAFLFVLGNDGNLYNVYTTETRGYGTFAAYGKVVSNVSKVYKAGNNIFALDTFGGLWAIGANDWGAMGHSDAYSALSPGMEWSSATKIEISGYYCSDCNGYDELTFRNVYMGTQVSGYFTSNETLFYTLIESTCGRVFAAGYNPAIFDDYEEHSYFAPVGVPMPDSESNSYRTGYVYEEPLYANMFSDTGSEFLGWTMQADGSGTLYQPGYVLRVTAPTTVYAKWDGAAKKKIQYIPNGGIGVMATDEYPADYQDPVTLKKNAFTRKGYEFVGWSYKAEPDSTDYIYDDEAQIVISPGTTKLYAQWKPFSYTVKVGTDDVRVTSQSFTTHTLQLDTELTLGSVGAKTFTVYFNPNKQSSMSTTPSPNTTTSASASLSFYGWRLYEDTNGDGKITTDVDKYVGSYRAGSVVKNLTTQKGVTLYFFPYWGGSASYVKLPEFTCAGYDLIGFTPGSAYAPDYFASDAAYAQAVAEGTLVTAPIGSGVTYQPKVNGETLYAYYEAKTYEISLVAENANVEKGEITHHQTLARMTFDKEFPKVQPPQSKNNVYRFLGYYDRVDSDGIPIEDAMLYYDEDGYGVTDEETGKRKTWTIADGSVTTLYAYLVSEIEVKLDGRGATTQEQSSVIMTYGEKGPEVLLPKKTGYSFGGYYTGIRGTGTKYYDAYGKAVTEWIEKKTDTLYAYWIQNPVDIPEKEDPEIPEELPEDRMVIDMVSDRTMIQVYADDKNPMTGAETDVPPYQVSDIVGNRVLQTAGGIPSTEPVAIRAQMGTWWLSCVLERKSGIEQIRVPVTVSYRTQYEDAESEELIISEVQNRTIECVVPKTWSYWVVAEGGMYLPEAVTVENRAFAEERVEVPVTWEGDGATQKPSYMLTSYGEKENHIEWSTYDENGRPVLLLTLAEEEYIVSDIPGKEPDVTEHLANVCYNAAWSDTTQFKVRSDGVTVDGITVLPDGWGTDGNGDGPEAESLTRLEAIMKETVYGQTYRAGIPLLVTAENERYETAAEIVYRAVSSNVGGATEKRIQERNVNEINIHTPVVCIPDMQAYHETMYQCESIPEGHTVLVLDEEGTHSDFILKINNSGYHSDKKGYGERNYAEYLAQINGKVQNEVSFPFRVWLDIGNDGNADNDLAVNEGEWYVLGSEEQRFYLPVDTKEGAYEIKVRSVAINGQERTDKAEWRSNVQPAHYVAEGTVKVYVTGRLYDFSVYEVSGTKAWSDVKKEKMNYSVGENDAGSVWETLPLRAGGHPYYRNVGGLPLGGTIGFRMKSIGSFFGEGVVLTIQPKFVAVTDGSYREVDIYYEKEEEKGVFLRRWEAEACALQLYVVEDSVSAVREWKGTFTVPNRLYVAEIGTDVFAYQKVHGLTFTEEFWMENSVLMLKFACSIKNTQGEVLYYGMIPETIANNIWQTEAGVFYREDIDGNRYKFQGGEVAVIYPGDSAEEEDSVYGIY